MNQSLVEAIRETYTELQGNIHYVFVTRGTIYSEQLIRDIFPEIFQNPSPVTFLCDVSRDNELLTRLEFVEFFFLRQRKEFNGPALIFDDRTENHFLTKGDAIKFLSKGHRYIHPHTAFDQERMNGFSSIWLDDLFTKSPLEEERVPYTL